MIATLFLLGLAGPLASAVDHRAQVEGRASLQLLPLAYQTYGNNFDITALVRRLLQRGDGEHTASKGVKVEDRALMRTGLLRFVSEDGSSHYLVVELAAHREALHVHSVHLTADGKELELRVLNPRSSPSDEGGEAVVASFDQDQLRTIAGAQSLELRLWGWDETFEATLSAKAMRRIRPYLEALPARGEKPPAPD